uniref:SOSS complex subunit C n=1 Tax=Ailuropoda melanoleuca TaxID=9646 RepID=A0A7N5JI06_AILME
SVTSLQPNHPGANNAFWKPSLKKDFQGHLGDSQKVALPHACAHSAVCFITQDSAFGNHILPILPHLDLE